MWLIKTALRNFQNEAQKGILQIDVLIILQAGQFLHLHCCRLSGIKGLRGSKGGSRVTWIRKEVRHLNKLSALTVTNSLLIRVSFNVSLSFKILKSVLYWVNIPLPTHTCILHPQFKVSILTCVRTQNGSDSWNRIRREWEKIEVFVHIF